MNAKRVLGMTLAVFFGLAALIAPAHAAEKTYTMRIGTVTVLPHHQTYAIEEFKRQLDALGDPRLKVQTYPASQLGTIPQHLQGLQNGSIQAVALPNGFISPLVPVLSIVDLPFFFPNAEWMYRMFEAGYRDPINKAFEAKGLVFAASMFCPDRALFLNKPINTIEDFQGVRIRTYNNPVNIEAVKAWGAVATMMDTSEISVGIQQGTVDGIETDLAFWYAMKLFSANHYINAHEGSITNIIVLSKRWLDSLPEDLRAKILETAKNVPPVVEQYYKDTVAPLYEEAFAREKTVVMDVNPQLVEEMRRRSQPVHEVYTKMGPEFQATYDYYKDLIEKFPTPPAK